MTSQQQAVVCGRFPRPCAMCGGVQVRCSCCTLKVAMTAPPSCGAMTTAHAAHAMLPAITLPARSLPSFAEPSDDGVLRASSGVSDFSFSPAAQLSPFEFFMFSFGRAATTASRTCIGVAEPGFDRRKVLFQILRISRMNVLVNIPETVADDTIE